jgi:NADPH:quinone reductase-like Zn-dependent oxidoreductase
MDLMNPKRGLQQGLGGAIDGVATEYFVCDEEEVVGLPDSLSFEEAATLPVAFSTAWSSLCSHQPRVQAGQTVLCLGTGGVSLCAAQVSLRLPDMQEGRW